MRSGIARILTDSSLRPLRTSVISALKMCFQRRDHRGTQRPQRDHLTGRTHFGDPVEISGFSHFFGFEALRRSRAGAVNPSEYLENRPNWQVGMAFAKTRRNEPLL